MEFLPPDRDISKLDNEFKRKVVYFLSEVKPLGVFVTEARRSNARQRYLRFKGLSRTITSYHQRGLAIDIGFKDDTRTLQVERELYPQDMKRWREVADIAKKYEIDWGYDLWNWDKAHMQCSGKPYIEENKPKISEFAQKSVRWAIMNKIANGWSNPKAPVTKEEMAVMLKRTTEFIVKKINNGKS